MDAYELRKADEQRQTPAKYKTKPFLYFAGFCAQYIDNGCDCAHLGTVNVRQVQPWRPGPESDSDRPKKNCKVQDHGLLVLYRLLFAR